MPQSQKDLVAIAAVSTVSTVNNNTLASPAVDMQDFAEVAFILNTTDADADTTIAAKAQKDTVSNFASAEDIAGAAITQFTAAATAKSAVIWVRRADVDQRYVRLLATMGNGTSGAEVSIVAVGFKARYNPADEYDASEVVEIKALY